MMQAKRVVVTGASGGIGGAIARRFSAAGAQVINIDVRAKSSAVFETLVVDVTDTAALACAYARIDERFGGAAPDVFVGCAALSRAAHMLDVTPDEIDLQFAVNVKGLFLSAQAAARRMARARGGSIVLISSVAAEQAWVSESVYCMTKAATRSMMQAMAVELAPFGIRVNAVAPGPIDHAANDMAGTRADPEIYRHEIERTPLQRFGTPDEVADAVTFLAGASWINGATVTVDGGFMATGLGLFGSARQRLVARHREGAG